MVGAEDFLVGDNGVQVYGDAHEIIEAELVHPAAADACVALMGSQAGGKEAAEPEIEGRIPDPVGGLGGECIHEIPQAVYVQLVKAEDRVVGEPVVAGICRTGQDALKAGTETEGRGEPVSNVQLGGGGGSGEIMVVINHIASNAGSYEPVVLFLCLGQGGTGQQGQHQGKGI